MPKDPLGYVMIVLHAHLPYVRHPEHEDFLEEDWLFEAITETYAPIVMMLEGLEKDGVDYGITVSLSPPLCEMLADPLLMGRYMRHLGKLIELTDKELVRTRGTPFEASAHMYHARLRRVREIVQDGDGRGILPRFARLQEQGRLEIMTCAATHGFLPHMIREQSVRAQIGIAAANYRKHFGRPPRGMWMPECAYFPGLEEFIEEAGIRYTFLDTHGLLFADPRPRFGPFRPVYAPGTKVAFFARDMESAVQVWSGEQGYPGDPIYREFYRDLGYDCDYSYVRPYLHADGIRRNIGIKYHRVTGRVNLGDKAPYDPRAAMDTAAVHAGNFMFNRQQQARWLNDRFGAPPVIVSPYDAELFGHWWFEGPDFINFFLRKVAYDQDEIQTITPSAFLARFPREQKCQPAGSSWGDKGYFEVWLNGGNDWLYRHLHEAERRMAELAARFTAPDALQRRALNQAARELLLAQASDWAFLMTTATAPIYAEKRSRDHIHRFNGLYLQLVENRLEPGWLADIEAKDAIFQELDYTIYA